MADFPARHRSLRGLVGFHETFNCIKRDLNWHEKSSFWLARRRNRGLDRAPDSAEDPRDVLKIAGDRDGGTNEALHWRAYGEDDLANRLAVGWDGGALTFPALEEVEEPRGQNVSMISIVVSRKLRTMNLGHL
jgi:hypothetical protein